jgi:hypothetical protein
VIFYKFTCICWHHLFPLALVIRGKEKEKECSAFGVTEILTVSGLVPTVRGEAGDDVAELSLDEGESVLDIPTFSMEGSSTELILTPPVEQLKFSRIIERFP